MNTESANRFIAALIKSLQTLCHGYVDFDDGIEIIGHLYLNIDSGSTFDYVLKEKVCKNAENSTVFVSKSFHAEGKPENTLIRDDKQIDHSHADGQTTNIGDNGMSPSGTTRIQSAITNISNVLAGNAEHHSSHSPLPLNAGRRKRDHNGSYSNQTLPYKYTTLQSSSSSAMPYFSNSAKHSSSRDNSKHYNAASQSQSEFFGGDSNQSSAMGGEDEEDLHLDVTFVKEEYGDRHRAGHIPRAHQDSSSNQSNMIPENNTSGGTYPMGYHPNAQNQQFTGSGGGSGGGDMSSINPSFQDPSQVDTGQHHIPPPNPRSNVTTSNALPQPSNNTCPDNNQQTFQVPATPSKYFRCNVCGIIIRHKNNIKRHMRRHNDPAVSGSIGGAASMSKLWSQHYSNLPTTASSSTPSSGTTVVQAPQKQARTYSCLVCGLQISHRKNVRRHMRKHTGEMFFCDLCDWKGTCRWKMQKHREKKHGIPIMLPVA